MPTNQPTVHDGHGLRRRRHRVFLCLFAIAAAGLLAACTPGGARGSSAKSSSPISASTAISSKPLTLKVLVSTPDVALFKAFGTAFHAKYPNVTVNVTSEAFDTLSTNVARLISGTDVPDLVRLASFGNLVKDQLLTSLDPYAQAYGWTTWPQSQFASTRVSANGLERGTGHLYGAGPGFGLTGVYYNKTLAQQIGMTAPPTTLAEFEQLMARAKNAGILPVMINGKDGGVALPLQNLQMDYAGSTKIVQDWNYVKPGANINTPALVSAADTLQHWSRAGYLPSDVNSLDQTQAPPQFIAGKALFFPSGNWQAPGLDKAGKGKFGFFLFPPVHQGDGFAAMTAADTLAIPAKAAHADAAAAFLNFVQTDSGARQDSVNLGGIVPAGPTSAAMPSAASGSVVASTIDAFQALLKSDGLVDFMANATASIYANTLIPQTQLLVAGKTSPSAFAAKVQADYAQDVQH